MPLQRFEFISYTPILGLRFQILLFANLANLR